MTAPYTLTLTDEQKTELQWVQASHPMPHFRVKATALLKVAQGHSIEAVRLHGLLKPVAWATVKGWIERYQQLGIEGWKVQPGRGRKSAFVPVGKTADQAQSELEELLHRDPHLAGLDRSCWWLAGVRQVVPWMARLTLPGIWKILKRFDLVLKRGRAHVHSPDPLYNEKMQEIERARKEAEEAPGRIIFLYEDEHTANVRPLVGQTYSKKDQRGQKATAAEGRTVRLAGVLDVATGQVLVRRRQRFTVKEMYRFFYHIEQHYPEAEVIYIALDNWPVHFHGYVKDNLARIKSKIRLLPLPTYAPWTNPIEKFWLKLNREFMKQHRFGLHYQHFCDALDLWLDKHRVPSPALLHEVGLPDRRQVLAGASLALLD